jgi:hypothetical protein
MMQGNSTICNVGDIVKIPLDGGNAFAVVKAVVPINRRAAALEIVCFANEQRIASLDNAVAWFSCFDEFIREGRWSIVGKYDGVKSWPSPPTSFGEYGRKDGRSGVFGRFASVERSILDFSGVESGLDIKLNTVPWLSFDEYNLLPVVDGTMYGQGVEHCLTRILFGSGDWQALTPCKNRAQVYRNIIQKLHDNGAIKAAWEKQRTNEEILEREAKREAAAERREVASKKKKASSANKGQESTSAKKKGKAQRSVK